MRPKKLVPFLLGSPVRDTKFVEDENRENRIEILASRNV
jgi:hypothetical protein